VNLEICGANGFDLAVGHMHIGDCKQGAHAAAPR
jgi:hypothetical protein